MSTLKHLYEVDGDSVLDGLHAATGTNRKYLWQIATGRRRPSSDLAKEMIKADPRLTLEDLLWPTCQPEKAQGVA